ncbi:MAG: DnaA regulatory inactivator Hda [Gammaproteobacteria bacterium RIFCSPHIGHO2_12_FULL_41_15]|nr:MAG: DnaA regulatory inactivator Hda [Gammaproteobacteria bacterium RIFCSPHIGHO2_12_FULL_41_15]
MTIQLTLPVNLHNDTTFANFYPGNNAHLIKALNELLSGEGERFIYLWGKSGVGKTHLLQACCHSLYDQGHAITYLSFHTPYLTPEIFPGLECTDLVCLDDVEVILGQSDWEEALLHFYNRARARSVRLIVSGNDTPSRLSCKLPDLHSRLAWGLAFQVFGLSDEQKLLALQLHASQRGLILSREVGQFLLRHYPRDMTALFHAFNKLDHASLVTQRRLTIPLVKEVLEI